MTQHAVELDFPSDLAEARRVQDEIEETLASHDYGDRDLFAVRLALEEALVNAIKHGNRLDPAKRVRVGYTVTAEQFAVEVRDEGDGFNPAEVPDPTAPENLERPCGRGLLLIRKFMTTAEHNPAGTALRMTKRRSAS